MTALRIDVWSDVACPWCWVGKRNLEEALAELDLAGEVEVRWHPFELDPGAPKQIAGDVDYVGRLARKYGASRDGAQAMIDRMVQMGAERGLEFRFDRVKPVSTFDAHRLLAFAATRGRQGELKERLFRAYMNEGRCVSEPDTLVDLAADAGLDPDEARAALATDAHADDVRRGQAEAAQLGITGVPFFVVAGRYAIPGAQPPEVMVRALRRAGLGGETPAAAGDACGPDDCDLPSAG